MVYKIEKRQDRYYLMNLDDTSFDYTVKHSFNCTSFLTIYDGTLAGETEVEITFLDDGEYQIVLTDGVDVITIPIHYYLKLQTSFISNMTDAICCCGCGCDDCNEDKCQKYCNLLMLRAKIDAYKRLINPEGVAFFDGVYQQTKCLLLKPIYCALTEEIIYGEAACNSEFFKKLLALDFLAIYFYEYFSACHSTEKAYIREKFNTDEIFCCIQDLGINIGEIETLIENNMGTFTVNNAAYVNLPPDVVGDITINVANRSTTVLTLAMFTTGTTPAYNDPEGDLPDAVRIDTLPVDGVLYLNAVAVTPGQVIDVADINLGLLTYESPDQDAIDTDTFDFSIRDTGSGLFSS